MSEDVLSVLSMIRTVDDTTKAFSDEARCRRLVEAMVWPKGVNGPAFGYKRSIAIAIAGRDMAKQRARPGLYPRSSGECRFQFVPDQRP